MFSIWWPAYVFPCIMVLCGLAGRLLPGRKYRSPLGPLTKERQEFADRLLLKLLWQFGIKKLWYLICFQVIAAFFTDN